MTALFKKTVLTAIQKIFFGGRDGLSNADEALRYLPISDMILHGENKDPAILEVGSGITGITPYIPFKVTGADVSFNGEIAENLEPVHLSGVTLPFPENSFDMVISVDMLEHVTINERQVVITELLRVARKRVFLAVPCGKRAEAHDKALDEYYRHVKGERYPFFREHVDNGLPSREEVETYIITSAGKLGLKVSVRVLSNVNLRVRSLFMQLWIAAKSAKLYAWVSPFICIFRHFLNSGECYRQIFIIDVVCAE